MKLCFVFLLCRLCDIVFQLCVQFLMVIQFITLLFFLFKFDLVLDGYLYQCVFKGHHMLNLLCTKKGTYAEKLQEAITAVQHDNENVSYTVELTELNVLKTFVNKLLHFGHAMIANNLQY